MNGNNSEEYLAARIGLKNELVTSSSGGVFFALATTVLGQNGCVFGCVWKKPEMIAVHAMANDVSGVREMQGSKYVRSDLSGLYNQVIEQMVRRKVLFTGTPCQVAALLRIIEERRINRENLFSVELICHGTPTPAVWEAYKQQMGKTLTEVNFKDKSTGWGNCSVRFAFADESVRFDHYMSNPYIQAFESGLSMHKSCFSCPFKNGKSGADLTIGDLWGGGKIVPEWNDDGGISCVIIRTEAGRGILDAAKNQIITKKIRKEDVVKGNPNLLVPTSRPKGWAYFQSNFDRQDMRKLVIRSLYGPWYIRAARGVKNRFKLLLK